MTIEAGKKVLLVPTIEDEYEFIEGYVPEVGDEVYVIPTAGDNYAVLYSMGLEVGDESIIIPVSENEFVNSSNVGPWCDLPRQEPFCVSAAFSRAVKYTGEIIYRGTFEFGWDGVGKIYVTGSPDSLSDITADDALLLSSHEGLGNIDLKVPYHGMYHGYADITSIFRKGISHISVYVYDIWGTNISCTPVYILNVR